MTARAAPFPAWFRAHAAAHGRLWPFWLLLHPLLDEQERWPLWLPVAFGIGIGIYFGLPHEPPVWLLRPFLLITALLLAMGLGLRNRVPGWPLLLLAMLVGGFAAAQARTVGVAAPVIPYAGTFVFEGRVVSVEPRGEGSRVVLDDLAIERLDPERTPARIRVTIRKAVEGLAAGARLSGKGRLSPPSGPLVPDGFDFARKAFFQRLGGLGFAYGTPTLVSAAPEGREGAVERLRLRLTQAVKAAVPGTEGAVATALITGLRADVPDEIWQDMQRAGLAHLLAISGLHMALVAGSVFIGLRYLLALVPFLALRLTAKKLAAVAAILAAGGYLAISGATVPTQRAFIMTGIALFAIVLDRSPISMRLVALAAFLVLLFRPESLPGPSFQMSFAAVIALIAWYERRPERGTEATNERQRHHLLVYAGGVAATTLIASLATAPYGAWHFQRVAALGVIANLIGVPLTAFWIMPAALVGVLLLPLGLADPFFWMMGQGIVLLLGVAAVVADLPLAAFDVPPVPFVTLLAMTGGGLWLCLWQGPWRRLGLIPLTLGVVLAGWLSERPVLLVDSSAKHVAFLDHQGRARLLSLKKDRFVENAWLRTLAAERAPWPSAGGPAASGVRCDEAGCILDREEGRIAVAFRARAAAEDCGRVDLLVMLDGGFRCPSGQPVLDRNRLHEVEGAAVYATTEGLRLRTVRERRGQRPWSR